MSSVKSVSEAELVAKAVSPRVTLEQLKANIKAQQDLLEETKRKRKENAIKGLLE